jgi:hypothetical protein
MSLVTLFLIFVGPYLVVGAIATLALGPRVVLAALVRPILDPPRRPVTRPRPARMAVAW